MMEAGSSRSTRGGDAAEGVRVNIDTLEPPPPVLQAFDSVIHPATSRPLDALATGVEVQTPAFPFRSIRELTGFHLEMDQLHVVKFIRESKEEICNNKELSSLVKEYLENSIQTLEFCDVLENCLKRARKNQLIIQLAVQKFEEEVKVQDGGDERKFGKTLDELNKFKAAEEPFNEEFFKRFRSVYDQQASLLKKLQQQKRKVDKKMKSVKTWRKLSNILLVSLFVSVVVFSVVAAATKKAPPEVTAVASTLVIPVGSLGKWCSWLLNRRVTELEWQKLLISVTGFTVYITIEDMKTVRRLVEGMVTEIESLLYYANFALGHQEAVKLVVDDHIKNTKDEFMETIERLGKQADKCSQEIRKARSLILQRIIEALSQSAAADSPWNHLYG